MLIYKYIFSYDNDYAVHARNYKLRQAFIISLALL